jgi:hypothetical protein
VSHADGARSDEAIQGTVPCCIQVHELLIQIRFANLRRFGQRFAVDPLACMYSTTNDVRAGKSKPNLIRSCDY